MRYVVYGDDATSQRPCPPLVVEAGSEAEARGRAVAGGMAVRAIIADVRPAVAPPSVDPTRPMPDARSTAESDALRGARRTALLILVPLAIAFFLTAAAVRTLVQAAAWGWIWLLGIVVGTGFGGIIGWLSRGSVSVAVAWPIGLAIGLTFISGLHGAQAGWRWWWAKRSLSPLAQAFGVAPEEAGDAEPDFLRVPVACAQGLAGAVLGSAGALAGWTTGWHFLAVVAWTAGGALGLGIEGAILGAVLGRRRPLPPPGAAPGPAFESFVGLLARLGFGPNVARNWAVGYALDRAVPGGMAGTFIGLIAFLLGWWLIGE